MRALGAALMLLALIGQGASIFVAMTATGEVALVGWAAFIVSLAVGAWGAGKCD